MKAPPASYARYFCVAAAFAGAIALGCAAMAEGSDKPSMKMATGAHTQHATVDDVNDRIEDLHKTLKITNEQAGAWTVFADAMRDNGKAIRKIIADRAQKPKTLNAVEDLNSYQELAQAHVDGLKKLIPAFEALYATMSADQKKNADIIFGESRHRAAQS